MAHHRRRKPAVRTGRGHFDKWRNKVLEARFGRHIWLNQYPGYWDILHHRRPRRRKEAMLSRAAVHGWIDLDEIAWPLSKKPHSYYW